MKKWNSNSIEEVHLEFMKGPIHKCTDYRRIREISHTRKMPNQYEIHKIC